MSFISMLHCLVLNVTSTESPTEASNELQLYMRSCRDVCEAISNIVGDDVFFGEIKQHKAYYLGNKGFYVPVELRSDDAVMKMHKGQCFNGGKKVDRKMNTDKDLIGNLDRIVFGFMIWLSNEGSPYSDMNIVKLIYDTLNFKLIDAFFRLQLHIRIDTCNEKIKEAKDCKDGMVEDVKECKDVKEVAESKDVKEGKEDTSMAVKNVSIQNILVFYSKELKSFFSEWKHHLEGKKTDIRIITEWYKRDSEYKMKEMVKPKTQVRLCKDLKQHCSIIKFYRENIKYVSMGLGQLSKDLIDLSFCNELTIYLRTLLSYDDIGSKLFAKKIEKYMEILYKNDRESNIADELASLQMRIRRRIFSYQKTMKGFLSNYSALLNHYNERNSDSQTPIENFEEIIGSIVSNHTEFLEMVQKVQAEEQVSNK